MAKKERWWTFPAEAENGKTIIVTGRDFLDKYIDSQKYTSRIDITWNYNSLPDGMPGPEDAELMGKVTDALLEAFKKENCAIMTGIYTGDGKREWVFYAKNLKIFSIVFNRALETLDQMPLLIEALPDSEWEEYKQMRELTYIPEEE